MAATSGLEHGVVSTINNAVACQQCRGLVNTPRSAHPSSGGLGKSNHSQLSTWPDHRTDVRMYARTYGSECRRGGKLFHFFAPAGACSPGAKLLSAWAHDTILRRA